MAQNGTHEEYLHRTRDAVLHARWAHGRRERGPARPDRQEDRSTPVREGDGPTGEEVVRMTRCGYCGHETDGTIPGVFDDAGWRAVQEQHATDCRWAWSRGFKAPMMPDKQEGAES